MKVLLRLLQSDELQSFGSQTQPIKHLCAIEGVFFGWSRAVFHTLNKSRSWIQIEPLAPLIKRAAPVELATL
jgi:hypothetical protein